MGVLQESESDSRVNGPRNIRLSGFDRVIQHDTVLDPDECGGPVLDTAGRVIGMNIARAGRVVSYSLPSSLILPEMVSMLEEARGSR
jgi:S1-C subfamily serine protease